MSTTVNVIDLNGSDVQNARDVSIGGKALVDGNVTIGHNLKVEGWLEAPNVKATNKGVFLTLPALQAAYPHPMDGWIAGVVTEVDGEYVVYLYVVTNGAWTATTTVLSVTLDVDAITQLQDDVEDLQDDMANVGDMAERAYLHPIAPFDGLIPVTPPSTTNLLSASSSPVPPGMDGVRWSVSDMCFEVYDTTAEQFKPTWGTNGEWKRYNIPHPTVQGVYIPIADKLYVWEGRLYYIVDESTSSTIDITLQPVTFNTDAFQAQLDSIADDVDAVEGAVESRLFINAMELLNLSAPTSLSAVISAIDALSDKAKYEVRGAVVTFEAAYPVDSSISMLVWETWQWGSIGNWTETSAWNKLNNPQIAIDETYLIRDTNGFLRLSDDARRAIGAVLSNAFSYEIIP